MRSAAATLVALCLLGSTALAGPLETVLYSFSGGTDGANPIAELTVPNGAIYSTTEVGGNGGNGTVFKLIQQKGSWTETVLYRFCALPNCADGALPQNGSLTLNADGSLYGTTAGGGGISNGSYGTVFKLAPPAKGQPLWQETVLYRFCALLNCVDGYGPQAGLLVDHGALYSTTAFGGSANVGTVFKLVPSSGLETVLYSFQGGNDGANPIGGVTALNGALYGTTRFGGASGSGTVFKLASADGGKTWQEIVLYAFKGGNDGARPYAKVIFDKAGALYGTTQSGGLNDNGTVFKIAPDGTETVLYRFCGLPNCSDGSNPWAGLILSNSGALYGTTATGGAFNKGTIFKLALRNGQWKETVLHSFTGADGATPLSGLTANPNIDTLFGAAGTGGTANIGTVFKLQLCCGDR
jgi:uncharacterized repeat protein (TIGR03803 family)